LESLDYNDASEANEEQAIVIEKLQTTKKFDWKKEH
jgi:hypothetical protein